MIYTLERKIIRVFHVLAGLFILLFVTCILLSRCGTIKKENTFYPKATGGIIDLSNVNLKESTPVKLDGEWEFYWNQLLKPEDFKDKPQMTGYINAPKSWNGYIVM